MRICIVGPGALGCLHAALIERAGLSVSLLDYRPDRAAMIREQGITVEEEGGAWQARPLCSHRPQDLPTPDLLVLCVKTFQTPAAVDHAAPLAGPDTVVLRIQNGLADPEGLLRLAPTERIVLATSGHGANTVGWGHIRRAGTGPTRLGPWAPEGLASAEQAAEALRRALPDVEVQADVRQVLWEKLVVNAAINPLTAVTGLRNGELLEVPLLRAALRDIAGEAERVAIARGVRLTAGQGWVYAEEACRLTAPNRSSMLQDVAHGRRTEIEDICGAVAREGELAGCPAPLNRVLTWLVTQVLPSRAGKASVLSPSPLQAGKGERKA